MLVDVLLLMILASGLWDPAQDLGMTEARPSQGDCQVTCRLPPCWTSSERTEESMDKFGSAEVIARIMYSGGSRDVRPISRGVLCRCMLRDTLVPAF